MIAPTRRVRTALLHATLPLLVTGCGSSAGGAGSDDPSAFADPVVDEIVTETDASTPVREPSATATMLGLVQIERPLIELDGGYAGAVFSRFDEERTYADLTAGVLPPLEECDVRREGLFEEVVATPEADGAPIDAGETLALRSPDGAWLTLAPGMSLDGVTYVNELDLPLPVPDDLFVDVTGGTFPAFANVPVPDVDALNGVAPDLASVSADTSFTWDVGTPDGSVFVHVELTALDVDGVVTTVDCLARDDGEFTVPEPARLELPDDFSAGATLTRLGITAQRNGQALLIVTSERGSN